MLEEATLMLMSILAMLIVWAWLRRRTTSSLPPGPWGLPIVGYLPWMDRDAPHETLTSLARRYGNIYSLRMGRILAVVLCDQKLIRQALARDEYSGRAPLYLTHGIMEGYGLICAQGDRWKEQRRFVATCLRSLGMVKLGTRRHLMGQRISHSVADCLQMIRQSGGEQLDPAPLLLHNIGNVVSSLVFGRVWDENDPIWKWLHHTQEEGTKLIGVAGAINFLPFLRFLPKYRRIMDFILGGKEKSHQLYDSIIQEHSPGEDHVIAAFLAEQQRRGILGDPGFYTPSQFRHLLADLFGAGLDTTVTTARWFLLFVAKYPEVQVRIQEELDQVIGDRLPTLDDYSALPYTLAAIAETQRLRSVVPVGVPHGTLKDTTLEGYHIPAGTMLIPLQWAVHMDPKVWKHPEQYRPERFLSSDGRFYRPDSFLPFQSGKRVCVGEELANMVLFLFGASILQQFVVHAPSGIILDIEGEGGGITLTPKHHRLVFLPREVEP